MDHQAAPRAAAHRAYRARRFAAPRYGRFGRPGSRSAPPPPTPRPRRPFGGLDPDVGEMLRRLGSKQVRATGTVGGNIANGSPIGDSPPVLIALGATIELRHGATRRTLALEDFFLDYGRQDRAPGEILTRITVPKLGRGRALALLQDLEALRPGHLSPPRRVPLPHPPRPRSARPGSPAAGWPRPRNAPGPPSGPSTGLRSARPRFLVRGRESPGRRTSRPSTTIARAPLYRRRVARSLLLKALDEVAGRPTTRHTHHRRSGTGARPTARTGPLRPKRRNRASAHRVREQSADESRVPTGDSEPEIAPRSRSPTSGTPARTCSRCSTPPPCSTCRRCSISPTASC